MRDNANIQLVGKHVTLVPYRAQFVPKYHQWMKDPYLKEMTASEELSIEEEYEGQQSWLSDDSKLTFIVLDSEHQGATLGSVDAMAGDVNVILNGEGGAEVMVMIAEESCRRKGLAKASVELIVWFTHMKKKIDRFFCKISSKNTASLALFQEKLGWTKCGYTECFDEVELEYVINQRVEKPEELLHVRPFAPTPTEDVGPVIKPTAAADNATVKDSTPVSLIKSKCFQTIVGDGIVDFAINGQVMLMDGTCFAMLTSGEGVPAMGSLNIALPSKYDTLPLSSLLLGDLNNESNSIATHLSQITNMCCYVSCSVQEDIASYVPHIARCIFQEIKLLKASP